MYMSGNIGEYSLKPEFEIVTKASAEAIIQLYKEAGWWKENTHSRAIIPEMIQGSFCFIIAKWQDEIIGMGRIISDGVSDAYIQDVVVQKKYRNLGLGKDIVNRLVTVCLSKKLESIFLVAEPSTSPFYKSLGFTELKNFQPMVWENPND